MPALIAKSAGLQTGINDRRRPRQASTPALFFREVATMKDDRPKRRRAKDYLSEFVRHVLMRKGDVIDTRSVYTELKAAIERENPTVDPTELIHYLSGLQRLFGSFVFIRKRRTGNPHKQNHGDTGNDLSSTVSCDW